MKTLIQAAVTFAVTNIDDIVVLALFFARSGHGIAARARVIAGQYLGFVVIVGVSLGFARAAALLPSSVLVYLGLLPLATGLRAAWATWRTHREERRATTADRTEPPGGPPAAGTRKTIAERPGIWQTAMVTLANGGDNIGVYVPIFATTRPIELLTYVVVFLVGVAVWCAAANVVVAHPALARILDRWGHIIYPAALIVIGLTILIGGDALHR